MSMRVLILTQTENGQIKGSSTGELACFGFDRNYEIWVADPIHISKQTGKNTCVICRRILYAKKASLNESRHCFEYDEYVTCSVSNFDVLLMRIQPPMDNSYFAICSLLAELPKSMLKINDPNGILTVQEKLLPLYFPDIHPTTLVSQNKDQILNFIKEKREVVVKPLNEYQGNGVAKLTLDKSCQTIIEKLLGEKKCPIIIQEFIPEVSAGDKRVFLLDGLPIAALNRVPKKGKFIASLHAGSSPECAELNERDYYIAKRIAPYLKEKGLIFVGLDIINGALTEIGTTSPTGFVQHRLLNGWSIADRVWDWIESNR